MSERPAKLSAAQRHALLWLAFGHSNEHLPAGYDSAHLSTLRSLERQGLVAWYRWIPGREEHGPRPYWVQPIDGALDHHGPVTTEKGEQVAADAAHSATSTA